jgi:hypothetical protein
MARDFTVRTFTPDELRNRWAYHNVRMLASCALGIPMDIAALVAFGVYGRPDIAAAIFLVDVLTLLPYLCYHFGAARTITKMAFGEGK